MVWNQDGEMRTGLSASREIKETTWVITLPQTMSTSASAQCLRAFDFLWQLRCYHSWPITTPQCPEDRLSTNIANDDKYDFWQSIVKVGYCQVPWSSLCRLQVCQMTCCILFNFNWDIPVEKFLLWKFPKMMQVSAKAEPCKGQQCFLKLVC